MSPSNMHMYLRHTLFIFRDIQCEISGTFTQALMHYARISSFLPTATNTALHQQNTLQVHSEDTSKE